MHFNISSVLDSAGQLQDLNVGLMATRHPYDLAIDTSVSNIGGSLCGILC